MEASLLKNLSDKAYEKRRGALPSVLAGPLLNRWMKLSGGT